MCCSSPTSWKLGGPHQVCTAPRLDYSFQELKVRGQEREEDPHTLECRWRGQGWTHGGSRGEIPALSLAECQRSPRIADGLQHVSFCWRHSKKCVEIGW